MEQGINLIKKYEGLRLKAYPDPATKQEPFTIGYGSIILRDGQKVGAGDIITKEEALFLLQRDIQNIALQINKDCVLSHLSDECKGAILSLCYNIKGGFQSFKSSLCYQAIKTRNIQALFHNWDWGVNQKGVAFGLARRRAEELLLFLSHF